MYKTILLVSLGFISMLHSAVTITTDKEVYLNAEPIKAHLKGMEGQPKDWTAIYKKGSNNEWKNVQTWKWNNGQSSENITFDKVLQAGDYEIRVFFNNSYTIEAVKSFKVQKKIARSARLALSSRYYSEGDKVKIDLDDMLGHPKDWVAIYKKGTSNAWANVLDWLWTGGKKTRSLQFNKTLPVGDYEVRVFFENSFKVEASSPFTIVDPNNRVIMRTNKREYLTGSPIDISFENMLGNSKDWIAIYKVGTSNAWKNVIKWRYTGGLKNAENFMIAADGLGAGKYEVRAFFKNSYKVEKVNAFTVYDDFPKAFLELDNLPFGVKVTYNKNKTRAYISHARRNNIFYEEHKGLTVINYENKNNPTIIAYNPNYRFDYSNISKNIILTENEDFILFEANHKLYTFNANSLTKVDEKVLIPNFGANRGSFDKIDGINLFNFSASGGHYTKTFHLFVGVHGTISILDIDPGEGFGYGLHILDYIEQNLLNDNKYIVKYSIDSEDEVPAGQRKRRTDIYDISALPTLKLLTSTTVVLN